MCVWVDVGGGKGESRCVCVCGGRGGGGREPPACCVVCMTSRNVNVARGANRFKSYYEMLVRCTDAARALTTQSSCAASA
ncbi:MAG: hypothetical protein ACKESB_02880 [Candidatus Hodgkinia cicadicola]